MSKTVNYSLVLCISVSVGLTNTLLADEKQRVVNHYLEADISSSYVSGSGKRIGDLGPFSPGLHVAHGSDITPVHALVMSYGRDNLKLKNGDDGSLTEVTFFLRRYIPKYASPKRKFYSTIGTGLYRYEKNGIAGSLENAGIIFGFGMDYLISDKLRLGLEADYRGLAVKQFGNNDIDRIRSLTLFAGIKYYYFTTQY